MLYNEKNIKSLKLDQTQQEHNSSYAKVSGNTICTYITYTDMRDARGIH